MRREENGVRWWKKKIYRRRLKLIITTFIARYSIFNLPSHKMVGCPSTKPSFFITYTRLYMSLWQARNKREIRKGRFVRGKSLEVELSILCRTPPAHGDHLGFRTNSDIGNEKYLNPQKYTSSDGPDVCDNICSR